MKKTATLFIWFMILFTYAASAHSAPLITSPIDTESIKLTSADSTYHLKYKEGDKSVEIPVPIEWLIPTEEKEKEEGSYVSSFNYNEEVTAFRINDDLTGFHISSFNDHMQGSAQAAAGRDVFLIYDSKNKKLHDGGLNKEITKERIRFGKVKAKTSHFFLHDMNRDGAIDLGVIKEEIVKEGDGPEGGGKSYYKQKPAEWYALKGTAWNRLRCMSGFIPKDALELPLRGIVKTPVDSIASALWKSPDPQQWRSEYREQVRFIPAYRKKLYNYDPDSLKHDRYIVKSGDALSRITARRYGDNHYAEIIELYNGFDHTRMLHPGDVLKMPDLKTIMFEMGPGEIICNEISSILYARNIFLKNRKEIEQLRNKALHDHRMVRIPEKLKRELQFAQSTVDSAIAGLMNRQNAPMSMINQLRKLSRLLRDMTEGFTTAEVRYYGETLVHQRIVYALVNAIHWAREDE